jgi:hypothetical protein
VSRRALALAAVLALAACTTGAADRSRGPVTPSVSLAPPSPESPSPAPEGRGSAAAALERLCTVPAPKSGGGSDVPAEGPTPPAIQRVMDQLEQLRGFDFQHRVVAEPVSRREIARGFRRSLDQSFPADLYRRRSLAWQTIGVIAPGTEIRREVTEYGSTQVIGYYDTTTGKLVFLGGSDPTPLESVTLAHELTHAIDDQRFGLERIDALSARCEDEPAEAALALVEGNATYFMYDWARTFLGPDQQAELAREAANQEQPPSEVAPFIERLELWPYTGGLRFVAQLQQRGGLAAIDRAFEELPVSTEQIIHPERYPNDVPTPVDVADLSGALGRGWTDLDVMGVGELWLATLLGLRLDAGDASAAASGWDGGLYRAWWDRAGHVAVVLETAWDRGPDAAGFAHAMARWLDAGEGRGRVIRAGDRDVRVVFGSDGATLAELARVARA